MDLRFAICPIVAILLASCGGLAPTAEPVERTPGVTSTSSVDSQFPQATTTGDAPSGMASDDDPGGMLPDVRTIDKWSTFELDFEGPPSYVNQQTANPFLIELIVKFLSPDGRTYAVPGFYAGDGRGGLDGSFWKVRFTPDQVGNWTYRTESEDQRLNGREGHFKVLENQNCGEYSAGDLPEFQCLGRLAHRGERYLQFPDGTYWLKGGANEPEDFLASNQTAGMPSKSAAIAYLAELGINSLYILLHNVGGDGRNVWPWLGGSQVEAQSQHEYFDIARLEEWEQLFAQIQGRGITLHLVLEDDSGWTGFNRELYYREMVARFGHHNGLIWNISEEYNENYTPAQIRQFAALLAEIDPYDHPITVHHAGNLRAWEPFLSDPNISVTSFQTKPEPQNESANTWFQRLSGGERLRVMSYDETGKLSSRDRDLARHILWSIYLAGGNYELYASPLRSYLDFTGHFEDIHRARQYLEDFPFCQMRPANELILSGSGYAFGLPDEAYVIYLPFGGEIEVDLSGSPYAYTGEWFDPGSGETSFDSTIQGGSVIQSTSPFPQDSVYGLRRADGAVPSCR